VDSSADFTWPISRLAEAVELLARESGLVAHARPSHSAAVNRAANGEAVDGRVEQLSRSLDFEVEASDVAYGGVVRLLENAAPALVQIPDDREGYFIALLGASGRHVKLLAPDGRRRRVPTPIVTGWLRRQLETPLVARWDSLLDDAGVPASNRVAARQALLDSRLENEPATRCWLLRPTPAAPLWQHLRYGQLPRRLLVFLCAYAGAALASAGAWWLIGAAAIEGFFDPGTLLAWSFLLLSVVPLGLFAMWSQGVFVLGASGILKMRLLAGALKLDPDETRHQGIGQHLARVIESESLEGLALVGGFYAFTGLFDLLLATAVLAGTGRLWQLLLLVGLIACLGTTALAYFRRRERWTETRLRLTHDLVERMNGHRTRLVQEATARHDQEDEALEQFVERSRGMDRMAVVLAAMPRSWLLVGFAGIAGEFVAGSSTTAVLAVGLGATLLGQGALSKLTASFAMLSDAAISWRQVKPLLDALDRPESLGHIELAAAEPLTRTRAARRGALINAQDVAFQFGDRADAVLRGCSFRIDAGDRIHLTGDSGAGKSTLVSLLTGVRVPTSGLLLLDGLDRATLGSRLWRRRVAGAPQFHENHIFTETLAFNLLMGRRWPPTEDDLHWAEVVCRRLGLGSLIDRMPGGIFQVVGEAGWQLSHGERSRVYMARALLQGADLVVLDESFAELDPDNLQRCLPEAADLSKSMIVIAHA
jgi:ATP-binding cassette, subfamily B, bacterial